MKLTSVFLILVLFSFFGCLTSGENKSVVLSESESSTGPAQDVAPQNLDTADKNNTSSSNFQIPVQNISETNDSLSDENETSVNSFDPSAPVKNSDLLGGSCRITVDENEIYAGESTFVSVKVSAGYTQTASYHCGNETRGLGTYGIFSESRLCTFSKSGEYDVWVAINGKICDSVQIKVLEKTAPAVFAQGRCSILNGTRESDLGSNTHFYQAKVNYADFATLSTLSWICQGQNFSKQLTAGAFGTSTGLIGGELTVNCQYNTEFGVPSTIPVYVENVYCGDLKK